MIRDNLAWIAILYAIHAVGLLSAVTARVSLGSRFQAISQAAFYACLGVVGGLIMVTQDCRPVCWIAAGFTFAIMVLIVVCDFRASIHSPDRLDGRR